VSGLGGVSTRDALHEPWLTASQRGRGSKQRERTVKGKGPGPDGWVQTIQVQVPETGPQPTKNGQTEKKTGGNADLGQADDKWELGGGGREAHGPAEHLATWPKTTSSGGKKNPGGQGKNHGGGHKKRKTTRVKTDDTRSTTGLLMKLIVFGETGGESVKNPKRTTHGDWGEKLKLIRLKVSTKPSNGGERTVAQKQKPGVGKGHPKGGGGGVGREKAVPK